LVDGKRVATQTGETFAKHSPIDARLLGPIARGAVALGFNYLLTANTTIKAEYRLDMASQAVFLDVKTGTYRKNNSLLGTTVVVSF
ncbi:MAG TPA: DUF3138 family protein, partial [Burkholderiaceae bacterium]